MASDVSLVRPDGVRAARHVELVATLALVGAGVEDDPARTVVQLWSPSGVLVAQVDPLDTEAPRGAYDVLSGLVAGGSS